MMNEWGFAVELHSLLYSYAKRLCDRAIVPPLPWRRVHLETRFSKASRWARLREARGNGSLSDCGCDGGEDNRARH